MKDYAILKEFLIETVTVAKALGCKVSRNGSYGACFQQIPTEVPDVAGYILSYCLLGAIEVVTACGYGQALGLTYVQRTALEAGFCRWKHIVDEDTRPLFELGNEVARHFRL